MVALIIALNAVGAVLELFGILLVSGRLGETMRGLWRYVTSDRRLVPYLIPGPRVPRSVTVHAKAAVAIAGATRAEVRVTPGDTRKWVEQIDGELREVSQSTKRLEARIESLEGRVGALEVEAPPARALGVLLLVVGLGFILAGNTLAVTMVS